MAGALRRRGVADPAASLVAEAGIAVFRVSFERWIDEANREGFEELIRDSLVQLGDLTASR